MVSYLQTITPIRLPINHIQNLILHLTPHIIPRRPVIPRSCPLLMHIEVLRVVDILIRARLDAIDHSRFEVEQDRAGDVACVVGLVEEDVFAVAAFGREVFEVAVLVDAVFETKLAPELGADWRWWWCQLIVACDRSVLCCHSPLLPHWPAWSVMISLWLR